MSEDVNMDDNVENNNADDTAESEGQAADEDTSSVSNDMVHRSPRRRGRFVGRGVGYIDFLSGESTADESECAEDAENRQFVPKVLKKPKPKHNWFMLKEIIQREYRGSIPPSKFTNRFYGSLHAVQRLELMSKLEVHEGCVNAVNFNQSGSRLVSGSDDLKVAVWDWAIEKCLTAFDTGHSSNVFQCKFLPLTGDGHIVTCSRDGQVRLAYQDSTGSYQCSTKLARHSKACHKLTILPHSPHVVLSAGEDAQVLSIDVREKEPVRLMHVKEKNKKISLYSIHSNPMTGNEICVAGEDHYIRIYDRRCIKSHGHADIKFKPSHFPANKPSTVYVTCAVFNFNGTEVIGSYNDDDIYLFDTTHSTETDFVHKYEGHRNAETVKGVNFYGPRSEYVVSGSDCGYVYVWDKHTESIVQWMRGDEDGVINCLEPHPNIPVLATSGLDHDIKVWIPSCENDPTMEGLEKCIKMNHSDRSRRTESWSSNMTLNATLVRWWRHQTEQARRRRPVVVAFDSLGFGAFMNDGDSSSSSFSSTSSD